MSIFAPSGPAGGGTPSAGTDHHSGWETILVGETVTIVARKQMVVFGAFIQDGTLIIDGTLILEP